MAQAVTTFSPGKPDTIPGQSMGICGKVALGQALVHVPQFSVTVIPSMLITYSVPY